MRLLELIGWGGYIVVGFACLAGIGILSSILYKMYLIFKKMGK